MESKLISEILLYPFRSSSARYRKSGCDVRPDVIHSLKGMHKMPLSIMLDLTSVRW
jgi:hypothetical protein